MPERISILVTAPPSFTPSTEVILGHECASGDSGYGLTVGASAKRATATLGLSPEEVMACQVIYQEVAVPGAIISIDVTIHDDSLGGPSLTEAVKKYVEKVRERLAMYHGYKPTASINASITRGKEMRSEWVVHLPG